MFFGSINNYIDQVQITTVDTKKMVEDVLQTFFCSVFVKEQDENLPDFERQVEEGESLKDINTTFRKVLHELLTLTEDN